MQGAQDGAQEEGSGGAGARGFEEWGALAA